MVVDRPGDGERGERPAYLADKKPRDIMNRVDKLILMTDVKYRDIINEASVETGVPGPLITAIIHCESHFNPFARSNFGAKGLMQLMDKTARYLGVRDSYDPIQNIRGGTRYFASLMKRFKNNISLSLAAYNAGPTNVDKYGGIPPFKQTVNYVRKVLFYADYYREHQSVPAPFDKAFELAVNACEKKDFVRAIFYFRKADPDEGDGRILYNLGYLHDLREIPVIAMDYYLKAIKRDPFLQEARWNLARLLERESRYCEALEQWKWLSENSDDDEMKSVSEKYGCELESFMAGLSEGLASERGSRQNGGQFRTESR
ncbi:MAG: hypothetical protein CVV64_03005 [Candidatus Wallbacteria bacterium HGW-Wallbacteria-1]|uniref:Transglycosylase SLT domain-containing protein n=1 Tax=Candidatus Wallbacteria bacterium HGW-Wallbacteria-1 TaxID=2013854 RepID=A0A2N1PTY5_9BACT|nr:MAG: hypothetical protein CVV64_03005 [Candidatus Wallbacteria bacterium HGW-Wallbacteria-1]